jgi:hypothetical protein
MAIHRALWFVSMDYHEYRLLQMDDFLTTTPVEGLLDGLVGTSKDENVGEGKAKPRKDKETSGGAPPNLGAEHTEFLRQKDVDGGLPFVFAMLFRGNAMRVSVYVPNDRTRVAALVLAESPVCTSWSRSSLRTKRAGLRTLVAVNYPESNSKYCHHFPSLPSAFPDAILFSTQHIAAFAIHSSCSPHNTL